MYKYYCHKCDKGFSQKGHLETHLNKKNPCDKYLKNLRKNITKKITKNTQITTKNIKEKLEDHQCIYCDKKFARKDAVIRHMNNSCQKNINIEDEHNSILKELINDMKLLKQQNEYLIKKIDDLENIDMPGELKEIKSNQCVLNYQNMNKSDNHNILKKKKEKVPQVMRMMVWDKYIGLDKGCN